MKSLKRVEGINVVPLIDVMLVLLAITLTISSFIALGKIELTLPQASSQTQLKPKKYEITITADKRFFINQKEATRELLAKELEILTQDDTVAISADKLSAYEDFIFVIDILKQKHIEKIAMVVSQ
jgi:biopolymer transport protein ExbD